MTLKDSLKHKLSFVTALEKAVEKAKENGLTSSGIIELLLQKSEDTEPSL